MRRDIRSIVKAVVCGLVIDGCGGTLGGNPEVADSGTQQPSEPGAEVPPALRFSITDAPVENAQHVFIAVKGVQIARNDGEWIVIPMEAEEEIDLLQLQNGTTSLLASIESLAAGTYGQTRLILADKAPGRLVDNEGVSHDLTIPSGSESGLKIQTAFTKIDDVPLELTIDFDLRKSIKIFENGNENGNGKDSKYQLKPVLRLADNSKAGSAAGEGQNGSVVCVYADGAERDSDDACENAISSATVKNSQFKLAFLEPGGYDLRVFRNGLVVGDVEDVVVATDAAASAKVILP